MKDWGVIVAAAVVVFLILYAINKVGQILATSLDGLHAKTDALQEKLESIKEKLDEVAR